MTERKTVYIVPDDSKLRADLSALNVAIYTVKLANGKEIDVCDTAYEQNEDAREILREFCEKATVEVVIDHEAQSE